MLEKRGHWEQILGNPIQTQMLTFYTEYTVGDATTVPI